MLVCYYLKGRLSDINAMAILCDQPCVPRIGDEILNFGDYFKVDNVTWTAGEPPRANVYATYVDTIEERCGMPKPARATVIE